MYSLHNRYIILRTEACGVLGAFAPDEIRISMFLPLMKKAHLGGIRGRRQD